MHGYKQIEHTADIAIEVYGDTIENLFHAGAEAWLDLSISGEDFNPVEKKRIVLEASTYEELLIGFLSEINFQLHVNKWLFSSIDKMGLSRSDGVYFLNAEIAGEKIDFAKSYIKEEIKAVTFHQVNIEKKDDLFTTKIVFDI